MNFIFLTLLIISGITYSRSDRYEVVSPADTVIALAGEDVILPCSVKPSISVVDMRVEWFRSDLKDSQLVHLYEDHEDRNAEQTESYRGRTKLNPQELQRGDASLKLSSVRVSDEGRYKCFIQSKSWSDYAFLDISVEAVGNPPVITVDGFDQSGGLHLQCESEGWNPEPFLEWLNSEGVRMSSEKKEMQRNTDGFSVKHTITVQHRDDKIYCRVRLRHHMLETLILTSSKSFNPWRTLIILSTIAAVLVVISGILLAVLVRKNREHNKRQNENRRKEEERDQLLEEKENKQQERDQLLEEKKRKQQERKKLQKGEKRIQQEYSAFLQNENQRIKQELQKEKNRFQQERRKLLEEKNRFQQEHEKLLEEKRIQQENYAFLQNENQRIKQECEKLQKEKNIIQQEREELQKEKNRFQQDRL